MFEGYQEASFRGVPFHCTERTRTGGRRIDVGEIPFAEEWTTRDMGRAAAEFTLSGFLFGQDWRAAADRLEEALDAAGPGRLVHPTRGEIDVHVRRWSAREDDDEGLDYIEFRIDCVPARASAYPSASLDHVGGVEISAAAVQGPAEDAFVDGWSAPEGDGFTDVVEEQSTSDLESLIAKMRELARGPAPSAAVSDFMRQVNAFSSAATGLIRTPGAMARQLFSSVGSLRSTLLSPFDALTALLDFGLGFPSFRGGSGGGPIAGPTAALIGANREALGRLTASASAGEAARAAMTHPFASQEDALSARRRLAAALGALEADARATRRRPEQLALADLRAVVWDALGDRALALPRLDVVQAPIPMSARALAWRERGSIDAASDLVKRNRVRHPARLPAREPLQLIRPDATEARDG